VLVAAGLAIFWPGRNAAPGPAELVAQEADPAAAEENTIESKPLAAQGLTMEDQLEQRTDVDFVELPLKDVIEFLQGKTGIQFYIKTKMLEEAGASVDVAVTLSLERVRLDALLDLILDELELTYLVKDNFVVITTPVDAENTQEIRVYDCRDLLAMEEPGGANLRGKGRSPDAANGRPSLTPPAPEIRGPVIGQPTLHLPAPNLPAAPRGGAFVPSGLPGAPATEPAAGNSRFVPASEQSVPSTPNTKSVPPTVLPQFGGGAGMPMPGSMGGGDAGLGGAAKQAEPLTPHEQKAERLMNIITITVDPERWDEVGGPGSIGEYNGLIVICQVERTHQKIENLLEMLRAAAGLEDPNQRPKSR